MANLREHSSATVDELRRFLEGMRGKSANEVLGEIAHSGLVRAVLQAAVVSAVGIALFTVGPYVVFGGKKKTSEAPAAASGAAATADSAAPPRSNSPSPTTTGGATDKAGDAETEATAATATPAATGAGGVDLERAAEKLGVGETKAADPKSNPREKDLDSLLDKVK
ncbi:MAG: hypothetical protein U0939_12830 [Pirellulales bacterium]